MTALDRVFLDELAAYGDGDPVSRKLALTVRPAFVARKGKVYVWSDWSQIEARMMPWLSNSAGGERKLDLFRNHDRDPVNEPDVYKASAGDMLDKDWRDVTDLERQSHGKVTELSLQFGGANGALQRMAANYRVYIPDETSRWMVEKWREENAWAVNFWGRHNNNESYGLWGAACSAVENPGDIQQAGRVAFVYNRSYLRGTLFMALPSGRLLTYPRIKWANVPIIDKMTKEVIGEQLTLVYRKGYGYSSLWHGKLAENCTQAESASVLRGTLRRLAYDDCVYQGLQFRCATLMPTVGHTHDEIVTEPHERDADVVRELLHGIMVRGFDWSAGLPLAAEETVNWYYTKAKVE